MFWSYQGTTVLESQGVCFLVADGWPLARFWFSGACTTIHWGWGSGEGPENESKQQLTCFLDCTIVAPCLVVGHLLDNRKNITSSPNEPKCVLNIQQMAKGKAQNLVSTSLISCPCTFSMLQYRLTITWYESNYNHTSPIH